MSVRQQLEWFTFSEEAFCFPKHVPSTEIRWHLSLPPFWHSYMMGEMIGQIKEMCFTNMKNYLYECWIKWLVYNYQVNTKISAISWNPRNSIHLIYHKDEHFSSCIRHEEFMWKHLVGTVVIILMLLLPTSNTNLILIFSSLKYLILRDNGHEVSGKISKTRIVDICHFWE